MSGEPLVSFLSKLQVRFKSNTKRVGKGPLCGNDMVVVASQGWADLILSALNPRNGVLPAAG